MEKFIDFSEFKVDVNDKVEIITEPDFHNGIRNTAQFNGKGTIDTNLDPLSTVLGCISNVAGALENIIISCNVVRMEKEKTEQARLQTNAIIAKLKEETRQITVYQREETKRLKAQLSYDYKKFKANLLVVAIELELKNNELIESGRKFDLKVDEIRKPLTDIMEDIKSKNNMILEQWQQGLSVDETILRHVENLQSQSNQLMIALIGLL